MSVTIFRGQGSPGNFNESGLKKISAISHRNHCCISKHTSQLPKFADNRKGETSSPKVRLSVYANNIAYFFSPTC